MGVEETSSSRIPDAEIPGQVDARHRHRDALIVVPPLDLQHLLAGRDAQGLGQALIRRDIGDPADLHGLVAPVGRQQFGQALEGLEVLLDLGRTDEGALPLFARHQMLGDQHVDGLPDRDPAHPQGFHQFAFRRDGETNLDLAGFDLLLQQIGDLPVDRLRRFTAHLGEGGGAGSLCHRF